MFENRIHSMLTLALPQGLVPSPAVVVLDTMAAVPNGLALTRRCR